MECELKERRLELLQLAVHDPETLASLYREALGRDGLWAPRNAPVFVMVHTIIEREKVAAGG